MTPEKKELFYTEEHKFGSVSSAIRWPKNMGTSCQLCAISELYLDSHERECFDMVQDFKANGPCF